MSGSIPPTSILMLLYLPPDGSLAVETSVIVKFASSTSEIFVFALKLTRSMVSPAIKEWGLSVKILMSPVSSS